MAAARKSSKKAGKLRQKAPGPPRANAEEDEEFSGVRGPFSTPPHPSEAVIFGLRQDLERVNATLITRNEELDAAKKVADREIFKDVVVLAAMLDAKAYISTRGGLEGALIIQRITNVEQRLGAQALCAAIVLQKIKSLCAAKQAGHEVFPEELEQLFKDAEKLL